VALRRGDTHYPVLLIIDSPRLALNTAEDLSAALYRRLVTIADASPGQVQFLIADNQLPATTAATRPRSNSPTTPPPSRPSTTPAQPMSTPSRWMNQTGDTGRPITGCVSAGCRERSGGGLPQQFADGRAVDTWQHVVPQYCDENRLVCRDVRQRRSQGPGTEIICEGGADGGHNVIVCGPALFDLADRGRGGLHLGESALGQE
jgi:hypothetical protein